MAFAESTSGNEIYKEIKKFMHVFISGSTGFIGQNLALKLANSGYIVHALYRDMGKTQNLDHPNIVFFKGDILNIESIVTAMEKCELVFHVAAFTEVWAKNEELIYKLNVKGTENVLKIALKNKVKRLVFTSTAGVFGPSDNGTVNENTKRTRDYFLEYERTKAIAEELVKEYANKGLNGVIVNPTRVFGPGTLSKSNSVTIMIKSFSEGKWRVIPGNGKSIGNYVFIDDVVEGHILAMEKGIAGEQYILGGENISYIDFFEILRKLTKRNHFMFKLPLFLMLTAANFMMLSTRLFGTKPLITPALVRKFNFHWNVSSEKAIEELGYKPVSFEEGAGKTLDWIKRI